MSRGHYAQQHVLFLDQMSVSSECHFMQLYTDKSFPVFSPNLSGRNIFLLYLIKKVMAKAQKGKGQELNKINKSF